MDKGLDIEGLRSLLACHAALGAEPLGCGALRTARNLPRHPAAAAATLRESAAHAGLAPCWDAADRAFAWAANDASRHLVPYGDARYPDPLYEIATPPVLLFVDGRVEVLARPQLAIVGSRKATASARAFAAAIAVAACEIGLVVTSGMAWGIDAAAHVAALEGSGETIAVFGCGIDRVYPASHRKLAERIRAQGALVSEFPLGEAPRKPNFPQRNRLIAGLSLGTLVVEAALRSGSLSTARHALEQGREVFAVPGNVGNPLSRGCHDLLRQGAKLTESIADIIEEIPALQTMGRGAPDTTPAGSGDDPALEPRARRLLEAWGWDAVSIDELADRAGLTVQDVSSILLALELAGHVETRASGTYARVR
ncbi:MAG: DNA-processing protein DprA [Gammaproteobacteria bacterium]